jgi:hypothetical protein
MSGCSVCSGGGAEFFTQAPAPTPTQPGCSLKGQVCFYNAQGELSCTAATPAPPTKTPLFEGFQERAARRR